MHPDGGRTSSTTLDAYFSFFFRLFKSVLWLLRTCGNAWNLERATNSSFGTSNRNHRCLSKVSHEQNKSKTTRYSKTTPCWYCLAQLRRAAVGGAGGGVFGEIRCCCHRSYCYGVDRFGGCWWCWNAALSAASSSAAAATGIDDDALPSLAYRRRRRGVHRKADDILEHPGLRRGLQSANPRMPHQRPLSAAFSSFALRDPPWLRHHPFRCLRRISTVSICGKNSIRSTVGDLEHGSSAPLVLSTGDRHTDISSVIFPPCALARLVRRRVTSVFSRGSSIGGASG